MNHPFPINDETKERLYELLENVLRSEVELYHFLCNEVDIDEQTWDKIQKLFDDLDKKINNFGEELYFM